MSAKAKGTGTNLIAGNEQPFQFKQFSIKQDKCSMKVGTDGILLGAWADISQAKRILDIGAGTGIIAIMLGQRNEEAIGQTSRHQAVSQHHGRFGLAGAGHILQQMDLGF